MSSVDQATFYRDPDTGFLMMPGTKRPDGTWRKPRRIKEGYVPQEEVPLYESKGKQWAKAKETNPIPGLGVLDMKIGVYNPNQAEVYPNYIPGLGPTEVALGDLMVGAKSKNQKKKKKSSNANKESKSTHASEPPKAQESTDSSMDPNKKLRNLRKKLRDIEALQAKLDSGELKKPEPEQLEKLSRRDQVETEIEELESLLRKM